MKSVIWGIGTEGHPTTSSSRVADSLSGGPLRDPENMVNFLTVREMIQKLRGLGLGLFPPKKDAANVDAEEVFDDCDSPTDGMNGFPPVSSASKSSRTACGPELYESKRPSGSFTSSRNSYGLELFEAERRKERERREQEREKIPCRIVEPEVRSEVESGVAEDAQEEPGELYFIDEDDRIKLVKKRKVFASVHRKLRAQCYLTIIPRSKMAKMLVAPDSYAAGPSVPDFCIQVLMVHINHPPSVDAAVDWLLADDEEHTGCIVGLDCQLDTERVLNLIQLSLHGRCILIRLTSGATPPSCSDSLSNPDRLVQLLATSAFEKTGTDIEDTALAIYWATGMIVNGCKNIAQAHIHKQRPLGLLKIFRKLYGWDWSKQPEITKSNWGSINLSSKQIKYAIMNAWSSRMIALKGEATIEGAVTLMSLENLPLQVLDLFGRALADAFQTEESVSHEEKEMLLSSVEIYGKSAWIVPSCFQWNKLYGHGLATAGKVVAQLRQYEQKCKRLNFYREDLIEICAHCWLQTSGTLSESSSPGTLQLLQHSFRTRVKGKNIVEIHLKEDKGSAPFKVQSRKGKTVLLAPCQNPSRREKNITVRSASKSLSEHASGQPVPIETISSLTVLEGPKQQTNWRSKRLWESLRSIVRNPDACPKHLLLALGCDESEDLQLMKRALDLQSDPFMTISSHLNDSQREAWQTILTSPLSATIGPPGTGKTCLISAVAKSWIAARRSEDSNEVLLCTACQNVAVRHLAETLVEGKVPGVLLLISEDYYAGWHEGFYTQLVESLVVSTADQCEFNISLAAWRTRNEDRESPNVVLCTVDLVGCPSFLNSLMNGKVTGMIIDESSQASDVSFLRPLISLPNLTIVSVLGDPHQLPPYSVLRNENGVPSVFDLVSNGCKVNFLREQYRMPPSICEFLSAEIYDNVLMTSPHRVKEKDTKPLVWSHVKGVSTSAPGKTSLHNVAEANAIIRFCTTLVRTMGVPCDRVVVLTLYEEQTRQISQDLAASELDIPVHNVDSFQGQQCDLVLISLVVGRSFSPFAADQRRACVMLSRVRRLLCVFGDFDEVKRNHQAGLWMKLANHCNKHNLVVDNDKVDCFLGATIKEAKEKWEPRQEKILPKELLPDRSAVIPPVGIAVQVMFRAR